MNAPFTVAQAMTTGQGTSQAPQIVKLTKPANGQAVSLTLDANTRLDFSDIAGEQITLVRVGNQLVILFDNQTTITAGPFFDASGNPLPDVHVDLGNNRIVDGQEFAGLFPISTDTNILPASGAGGGGDGFLGGDPNVDPLNTGNPLDLLGNEDGNGLTFSITEALGRNNNETTPIEPAPTAFSQTVVIDEDGDAPFPILGLPDRVPGGPANGSDDPTAPLIYFGGSTTGTQVLFNYGPDGPAAVDPIVFDVTALNLLGLTSGGLPVVFTWDGTANTLTGMTSFGPAVVLGVDPVTGDFAVGILRPLDHAAPSDGVAFENEIVLEFPFTLTDGNGTQTTGTLTVNVDDDSPELGRPAGGTVEEGVQPLQIGGTLDIQWGADNFNGSGNNGDGPFVPVGGPGDRSVAFADTTASANVVAKDVDGAVLPGLTSNGDPVLYTILAPTFPGGPIYLVAYTDLPAGLPPKGNTESNVVFWVSLSDFGQGGWQFELRAPLDHLAPGGLNGDLQFIDLTFLFKAFDSDGDGVAGTFTVQVDAAGQITFCGCGFPTIDYSSLVGGVFINLDNNAHTELGQTVAGDTATDLDGVSPKVIGIDKMNGVVNAIGTNNADVIIGGDEGGILEGRGGADLIRGGRGADIIYGDAGQDTIYGGRGDDAILGGDGADTIYGGRGWDEIHGGAGADWISGGADSDFLTGDGGDDTIRGGAGADLIWGGAGEDDIRGGAGWDEIYGDAGNDTIRGGRGNDYIEGNGGDDNIRGGRGDDEIYGGAGNDTIRGGQDDDYIEGNGGDDRIIYNVGEGHDLVFGGGGDDIQEIYGTGDSETYNINAINIAGDLYVGVNIRDGVSPFDVVPATPGNAEVATKGVEDIYIDTGAGPDNVFILGSLGGTGLATSTITIEGGPGDDTDIVDASLLASNHSVTFYGRGGEDAFALNTGKGTDTFDGGSGLDTAFFSCNVADATIAFDGTHWTVTVGGSTDTLIGVEGMTFLDQAFLLVDHAGTDVGGFQTIQDAVDASCGCQTVLIAPGTYDENVTIDNNDVSLMGLEPARNTIITGQITVSGEINSDVTFSNLAIDAAGETYGVFVTANSDAFGGEIVLDNVLIENAGNNGFAYIRAGNGGVPTLADTIGAIAILNSEFAGNGGAAGNTNGDILIYGFNGDLTVDTVSIHDAAAGADKAIQVRGIQDPSDVTNVGPFASFGDVTITNLTITGTYSQDLVAFYRIADFANFIATNVTLDANAPWGLFNLDEAGGTVDLSGVAGTNGAGPFIATMQGLDAGDVFTGTGGNDMFVGRGGDDNLAGGGGNDTFVYSVGGGRDIVDGGTESGGKDVLDITGTSANENFFIEIPAEYTARTGNAYAGSEILVSSDDDILVEASEIEDIVIHGGGGADTLTVSGSFTGTSLLTSTITYDSGAGDDTLDLRNRDSNHRVVADGSAGTDTVIYDFARSSVTSVTEIYGTDGVTVIGANITHNTPNGPVTDVLKNFESFQFTDGTLDLNTVFNQAPNAVDDTLAGLYQYQFSGTVTGQDEFVPWSSTYTFTLIADRDTGIEQTFGTGINQSFGYEIPLVTSATLSLPYFSPDVMTITTPMRLGYNTTFNAVFFGSTEVDPRSGVRYSDAYTIRLTDSQEGIVLSDPTFGPLTGVTAQFNFDGMFGIIGSGLPEHIVFTGGIVTGDFTASAAGYTEDTAFTIATSVLTGNDSDPDGNPITLVSVQDAVGGIVSLSGGNVTFVPAANYFGAASFTYTIQDPLGLTDTATVSFNIYNVNDAPVLDLDADNSGGQGGNHYATTFTEGGARVAIADGPLLTDVDDTQINRLTVTMIKLDAADTLEVNPLAMPGGMQLVSDNNASYIKLTFSGAFSLATYQALLSQITYGNASENPAAGDRTITVEVNDGHLDSAPAIAVVTVVPVNDAPDAVDNTLTNKTEDTPFTIAASVLTGNDSDPDGTFTVVSVHGAVGGSVSLSGGNITFVPTANYFGAAGFTYAIQDAFGAVDTAAVSFNINNVNDAPAIDLDANDSTIGGGASLVTYNPGGAAIRLTDTDVSISDVDSTTMAGATIAMIGAQSGDLLGIASGGLPAGITVQSQSATSITLTGTASLASYEAAIEAITFSSSSVSTTQRSLSITINDGTGGAAGTTALIGINSPPTIVSAENGDITEDSNPVFGANLTANPGLSAVTSPQIYFPGWTPIGGWIWQRTPDGNNGSDAAAVYNGGYIFQNVSTVAGQLYQLDYYIKTYSQGNLLQVLWDGVVMTTVSGPSNGFTHLTLQLVGDGDVTQLRFVAPSGAVILDDVYLRPLSAPAQQTDSGTIVFGDVNTADTHSATFAEQALGYIGTFTLGAVDQNGNSVGWNFVVDNSALQTLGAGDTLTQTYAVTVTDQHGSSVVRNVTVTMNGVNDAVVITSNDGNPLAVSVVENSTAVATIVASDADVGDVRTWSLDGADKSRFNISNTGVITFKNAPDFESPSDSGNNNIYDLIVNVSDGTLTDTQAVTVTVGNVNDAPSGANNNISITEDVTYTFAVTDFGFSDGDGNQFAGVVVNTSPDSAHGQLFLGGLAVNAGDTISAADIAAGMLTYTPFADRFNGPPSSFTFSVRDDGASGGGHQNTDQSPDTMRMTFTGGNQADNVDATPGAPTMFSPTTGGFQSFADLSASGSDEFRWNGLGGQFNSLDMQRNGDDLQITFNSNTSSGVFTILDQFAPGGDSTIEGMRFDTAMFYGQLGLAGPYTLGQATDGTGLLDILVGGSGNDTRSGGGNWDAIFGGGGNDTLNGGFENDILVGGLGGDILSGDSGRDFLIGGAGADTFRYAETGSANIDRILDYSFAEGDRLDLSSLLDANFGQGAPENSVVSNFVRVLSAGTDGLVQVDVDGTGGASTWTDVAVLASYSTGNQVLVNFENQAHQLQVA